MNTASSKYATPRLLRREKTTLSTNSDSDKDPVNVYCRLRPLKEDIQSTCIKLLSPTVLSLTTPMESKAVRKELHCRFKHIFTAFSPQKEVFQHLAYPLLEDLLQGKNSLLFTYGVTGSGKTYTLTGEQNNPGIMPRCIYTIFNSIEEFQAPKFVIKPDRLNGFEVQSDNDAIRERRAEIKSTPLKSARSNRKLNGDVVTYDNDGTRIIHLTETNLYSVFVSYIEIYNNTVYDLLDDSAGKTLQHKILREDANKNMYVNGVVEIEVKSAEEAFDLFNSGQKRKRMGHTALNSESSRSHSIFNIRVVQLEQVAINSEGRPAIPDSNLIKVGQLSLVDLAGSERTNRTQNTGARLREASSINNSLMSLRTCMEILRENQSTKNNKLVPYRDSRLTLLFKNYFEGEGSIQMIVCVNPSVDDFEENVHVMKFAEITQDVKIAKSESRYATPIKKTIERSNGTVPKHKTPSVIPSMHLPDLCSVKINLDDVSQCGDVMSKLLKIFKIRKDKSKTLNKEIDHKSKEFRKRLVEMNQENVINKSEVRSLKTVVHKANQKLHNLETKLTDLETINDNLATKNEEYQNAILSLRQTIKEKELKINQNILEKEKTKQRMALQSEKMSQELDMKLKKQRDHLNAAMQAKVTNIKKVAEQLCNEIAPINYANNPDENVEIGNHHPPSSQTAESEYYRRAAAPSSTPRRRSRSIGDVWLEHNSVKPVPLGTVLQPSIKKRKSVTKLKKASDITNPKQSKYCLIAQNQDHDGEVETKVYKADILPTCGGGAQVIFNDVEKLRQESPTK